MGSSVILPPMGQPAQGPDPNFVSAAQPTIATFGFKNITPPSPLYVTRDDTLFLTVNNSVVNQVVGVVFRFLEPYLPVTGQPDDGSSGHATPPERLTGYVSRGARNFPVTSDRTNNQFAITLGEGFLLAVSVGANVFGTKMGQTFISLRLQAGESSVSPESAMLLAGYVATRKDLTWPGNALASSVDGAGWAQSFNIPNPAAGADFSQTVPTTARWRIRTLSALFTASAAAANRFPVFTIDDGANLVFAGVEPTAITAGQAYRLTWAPGLTFLADTVNLRIQVPAAPEAPLLAGWRVRSSTTGIQGGDQWSTIQMELEEWIDN